ncbi:MAG: endonuclease [Bdellovibrio sp.]|nr:endonuclease [Bdellovibrio sp.]
MSICPLVRLTLCCALCLPFLAFAQFPSYYPIDLRKNVEAKTIRNEELKKAFFTVLQKGHHAQTYNEARKYLFGKIHLESDGRGYFVRDVYCNRDFRASIGVGPMSIPKADILNCEHTWPQSKFSSIFPKDTQKADLHHLYPADSKVNNTRGNLPFAEVTPTTEIDNCPDSSLGVPEDGTGRASSLYFTPPRDHQGNVARALFYFSIRYKMPIDPIQEKYLRQWHLNDPVDQVEQERNNTIEEIQGNRNPFTDMPEAVQLISDF